MPRFIWPLLIGVFMMSGALAESPKPSPPITAAPSPSSPSPSPSASASPSATPATMPSPSNSPTREELVNSLGETDVQAAITLLRNNFTNPDAINETELNRATLEGLLVRQSRGVTLLPGRDAAPAVEPVFYSEIFDGHVGYIRFGGLNGANLKAFDKKLTEFASKKIDALVLDLRDTSATANYEVTAEFAKRFCPKGKPLFTLRKPAARQDRPFTSDRDPAFQGMLMALIDRDTIGGGEVLAALLRFYDKALLVGQPTAGRAAEYSDLALSDNKILRVAVAETVLPDGQLLFPDGVKPDLPVEMPVGDKRQIFQASVEKGMAPFVYETERPHLNEAALLAGTNPELDSPEAQRRNRGRDKLPARDPVLQRALDLVTSLAVFQKR